VKHEKAYGSFEGDVSTKSDAAPKFQDQSPLQPIGGYGPENFFLATTDRMLAILASGFLLQSSQDWLCFKSKSKALPVIALFRRFHEWFIQIVNYISWLPILMGFALMGLTDRGRLPVTIQTLRWSAYALLKYSLMYWEACFFMMLVVYPFAPLTASLGTLTVIFSKSIRPAQASGISIQF